MLLRQNLTQRYKIKSQRLLLPDIADGEETNNFSGLSTGPDSGEHSTRQRKDRMASPQRLTAAAAAAVAIQRQSVDTLDQSGNSEPRASLEELAVSSPEAVLENDDGRDGRRHGIPAWVTSWHMDCLEQRVELMVDRKRFWPGDPVSFFWDARRELDSEADCMMVDFFSLHKEEDYFGNYESSRWRINRLCGNSRLFAPTIPGFYRLSCVRNVKDVWKSMQDPDRKEAYRKTVKLDHTKEEQFMCLGSVIFQVEDPLISPRPVLSDLGFWVIPEQVEEDKLGKKESPVCFVTLEGIKGQAHMMVHGEGNAFTTSRADRFEEAPEGLAEKEEGLRA